MLLKVHKAFLWHGSCFRAFYAPKGTLESYNLEPEWDSKNESHSPSANQLVFIEKKWDFSPFYLENEAGREDRRNRRMGQNAPDFFFKKAIDFNSLEWIDEIVEKLDEIVDF